MQWVINEIRNNPKLRDNAECKISSDRLEKELWAYDNLLKTVGPNGVIDSVKDNCNYLDVTSDLIRKIKARISDID